MINISSFTLRLSLCLYTGLIACLSNLISGEITNLQHGYFGEDGYQLFDLTILLSCLILGFLLITLLFKKPNFDIKPRTRTGTAIKGIFILLITIPFLVSLSLFFYNIYLRLGVSATGIPLQLGPSGEGISLTSFLSGFLLGTIVLPRFVITNTYAPKQALFGSILTGIFAILLFNFISVIEDRLSIIDLENFVEFPGLHFKLIFGDFLFLFLGVLYTTFSLSLFILLPLWGLFGWLTHRWFYQRQHHFWSQDLVVFE